MPFDPNSPFDPADPAQWWQLRTLPRISIQPTAPPNAASGSATQSNRIGVPDDDGLPNDWFVPEADGYPNDWFVPEADGFPNDWIYPDNQNAPTPAAVPPTAPPAPSPQINAAKPATPTRPAARFDPYEAFWAQMPASRVGAMAWHPPIFLSPDSFAPQITPSWARGSPPAAFSNPLAQFLPATSALPTLPPDFGTGGILGGIAKLAAEQARANDPWALPAGGILGGIAKLATAYASSNLVSIAASRGPFGSLANLQPADSNAQAAPSSLPMSRRFLPPDPIEYQGPSNLYSYVGNDPLDRGDTTGFAADQLAIDRAPPITTPFPVASALGPNDPNGAGDTAGGLGSQYYRDGQADGIPTQPSPDVSWPPIRLVNDNESPPEDKLGAPPHLKYDPSLVLNPFGESNSVAGRIGWGAGTPGTALVPYRPPAASAPPPPSRASLPPPSQPSPGAPSPSSTGQAAIGPRLPGTLAGTAPAVAPAPQSASTTRDGLLRHVADAQARLKQVGLTFAQKASLKYNPWLEPMHRGERIDTFAKESVAKDPSLRHLKITQRFEFGPDFYDPINNRWYDVTTIGQWDSHEGRYTLGFGQGIPLLYGGDK
jgi:hypothetical protein